MKIALIVGHDEKAQGAVTYNKITEYEYNTFICDIIKNVHAFKVSHGIHKFLALHVFNRNHGWQSVINQLKANDISMSIELHLNSYTKSALGTETLCLENDLQSHDLATHLSYRIARLLNTKLRGDCGVVQVSSGDRGYQNLLFAKNAGVKYAVLVEPAFVNFPTVESIAITNNPLEYANILYRAIEDYYSVLVGGKSGDSKTIN